MVSTAVQKHTPPNIKAEEKWNVCYDWANKYWQAAILRVHEGATDEVVQDLMLSGLDWATAASERVSTQPYHARVHRYAAQLAYDLELWDRAFILATRGLTGDKVPPEYVPVLSNLAGRAMKRRYMEEVAMSIAEEAENQRAENQRAEASRGKK